MKLYVVGKVLNPDECEDKWEFFGVFDSEEKAVKACKDANYFVGPVELNEELSSEPISWPNSYYPLADIEEQKPEKLGG